jgi:hypothetical protein
MAFGLGELCRTSLPSFTIFNNYVSQLLAVMAFGLGELCRISLPSFIAFSSYGEATNPSCETLQLSMTTAME